MSALRYLTISVYNDHVVHESQSYLISLVLQNMHTTIAYDMLTTCCRKRGCSLILIRRW